MTFRSQWVKFDALAMASTIKRMNLNLVSVEFDESFCIALTMISKAMMVVNGCLWIDHLWKNNLCCIVRSE